MEKKIAELKCTCLKRRLKINDIFLRWEYKKIKQQKMEEMD